MFNKVIACSVLILILGSIGCSRIRYHVATRVDPDFAVDVSQRHSFALKYTAGENEIDPIIEKKLLRMMANEAIVNGWREGDIRSANFVFQVEFAMNQVVATEGRTAPRYTWYDSQGRAHQGGGHGYSSASVMNTRTVKMKIYHQDGGSEKLIWVADCTSGGSTPDILYAARKMVPFAISKFPKEGNWDKSVIP